MTDQTKQAVDAAVAAHNKIVVEATQHLLRALSVEPFFLSTGEQVVVHVGEMRFEDNQAAWSAPTANIVLCFPSGDLTLQLSTVGLSHKHFPAKGAPETGPDGEAIQ